MIKQYPLRIDSELKTQIEAEAKKHKRSFNNFVEILLTQHIDKIKSQEKSKEFF